MPSARGWPWYRAHQGLARHTQVCAVAWQFYLGKALIALFIVVNVACRHRPQSHLGLTGDGCKALPDSLDNC